MWQKTGKGSNTYISSLCFHSTFGICALAAENRLIFEQAAVSIFILNVVELCDSDQAVGNAASPVWAVPLMGDMCFRVQSKPGGSLLCWTSTVVNVP